MMLFAVRVLPVDKAQLVPRDSADLPSFLPVRLFPLAVRAGNEADADGVHAPARELGAVIGVLSLSGFRVAPAAVLTGRGLAAHPGAIVFDLRRVFRVLVCPGLPVRRGARFPGGPVDIWIAYPLQAPVFGDFPLFHEISPFVSHAGQTNRPSGITAPQQTH